MPLPQWCHEVKLKEKESLSFSTFLFQTRRALVAHPYPDEERRLGCQHHHVAHQLVIPGSHKRANDLSEVVDTHLKVRKYSKLLDQFCFLNSQ